MEPFNDHFSKQADIYAQARPTYPDELYSYLATLTPAHECCLDTGCGNGQASVALARYYIKVIAIDPSEQQINHAKQHPAVSYKIATAENTGLPASSIDLVTAATAAHWYNLPAFYKEVERILKPGGVIALWTYSEALISPEINELMEWFMYSYLHSYWPDGRWYVRNKYETLPFPYALLQTPKFYCKKLWTRNQWLHYIQSWSAYNAYTQQHNENPLNVLIPRLTELWKEDEVREVVWPLHLKCAYVH